MVKSEHKRQQKIAKRNQRATKVQKELRKARNVSMLDIVMKASKNPIEQIWFREAAGKWGLIAAQPQGKGLYVIAGILIDAYALGVKDVFIRPGLTSEMIRDHIDDSVKPMTPIKPEDALKLILGSIDFARKAGFDPHENTPLAMMMFKGIDPSLSTREFEFGIDGKPVVMI